jgi:hypothetical protein
MTDILQIDLKSRRQVQEFIGLPFKIYREIPQWVPPLSFQEGEMLDPAHNPFFRHSEAAFFLARCAAGEATGRLAVLDNRNYNEFNQQRTAFFFLFECQDDPQAAAGLFSAGCEWARRRGLERIVGPKGFTALDGLGMLVKGFEHRPAFGIPYNPAYYPALVEAAGFVKESELVSGYLSARSELPEKVHRAAELLQKRRGLRVARFETRRDLRAFVPRLRELYNNSLSGTQGNTPLTEEEARSLANQLLWFADPKLIKVIFKDDDPVGFLFAYPDISAALQRTRGQVLPLGWIDLLLELRRTRWLNINGAGISEQYRGLGGTAILFSELAKSLQNTQYEHADLVQIGVENDRMQRELRDLGVDFYKTHRLYQRAL